MTQNDRETEFSFIKEALLPLARGREEARGFSDDAARLNALGAGADYVVSVDSYAEGKHFLPSDPPASVGEKILRAALSDIAAMGAKPYGWLFSAAWGEAWDSRRREELARGLRAAQELYGVFLLGGDTLAIEGGAVFGATVLGVAEGGALLSRGGMREGDALYVSGSLGDAALGLGIALSHIEAPPQWRETLLRRYRFPEPRIDLGLAAAGVAHAAIDLSDGLAADLGHMCRASGVGARIDMEALPLSKAARGCVSDIEALRRLALNAGDDYELLLAAPEAREGDLFRAAAETGTPLTKIGVSVPDEKNALHIIGADGREIRDPPPAFSHKLRQ